MGNWTLTVRGIGSHHNSNSPADADVIAEHVVKQFKDKGHHSVEAFLTYGGGQIIGKPPEHSD